MADLDLHRFILTIKDDAPHIVVVCPYNRDDDTRPCWARDERGHLDDAAADECSYVSWVEEVGWEMVAGNRRFDLDGARWDWRNGAPLLHVDLDREHRNKVNDELDRRRGPIVPLMSGSES